MPSLQFPQLQDREWLHQRYVIEGRSAQAIADEIGCTKYPVLRRLHEFGFKVRKRQSRYPLLNDKEWLREQYLVNRLSARKIGMLAGGASPGNVHSQLTWAGIPLRSLRQSLRNVDGEVVRAPSATRSASVRQAYREKEARGEIKRGAEHHHWKGGTIRKKGYVMHYMPDHPRATLENPYVPENVLIMEEHLGRFIDPQEEHVHHINENRSDNRPENLEVKSVSEHMRDHALARQAKMIEGARRALGVGRATEAEAEVERLKAEVVALRTELQKTNGNGRDHG